jgi:hypothetical protein
MTMATTAKVQAESTVQGAHRPHSVIARRGAESNESSAGGVRSAVMQILPEAVKTAAKLSPR